MEHDVLARLDKDSWPSVGQLLLEVHIEGQRRFDGISLDVLFANVERANLRLFHHELNWEFGATCCIEYSFIHMSWRPGKRDYDMHTAKTYKNIPLNTYPQHEHLITKYLTGKERNPV